MDKPTRKRLPAAQELVVSQVPYHAMEAGQAKKSRELGAWDGIARYSMGKKTSNSDSGIPVPSSTWISARDQTAINFESCLCLTVKYRLKNFLLFSVFKKNFRI